jgi:hypothetical protein
MNNYGHKVYPAYAHLTESRDSNEMEAVVEEVEYAEVEHLELRVDQDDLD